MVNTIFTVFKFGLVRFHRFSEKPNDFCGRSRPTDGNSNGLVGTLLVAVSQAILKSIGNSFFMHASRANSMLTPFGITCTN
jgi:hypothetical protein